MTDVTPLPPPAAPLVGILLVEDEAPFAKMMLRVLAEHFGSNAVLLWASSLGECLAHAATTPFDLIALDLMLGDSRGLDTLRRVREAAPDTPIVVLTGLDSRELGLEALQAGANDYQVKGGDPVVLARALQNIIERHRIQRQLREAQAALRTAEMALVQAERMESVGRLAAGVAHEVKNPLEVIQRRVDALRRLPGNQPDIPASVLKEIADAAERARVIVGGLLTFSRPAEPATTPSNLPALVDEALALTSQELWKKDIHVVRDFAPVVPALLLEQQAITQVFVNLITNAVHAMNKGGHLRISIATTCLDKTGEGVGRRATDTFRLGQQVVTVKFLDSGPGIPAEALPKVFEPFFTTKPNRDGAGLGLYVCQTIISSHGGRIAIENAPTGGALVTVTFVA